MLLIEGRATANDTEYGPIPAHMGFIFAKKWANIGAWGRAGGDDWTQNCPQRRMYRRLAPRGQFLGVLGGGGQRLEMLSLR